MLGATGTIGRATVRALLDRGHEVVCFLRPRAGDSAPVDLPDQAILRFGDVTDAPSLRETGVRGERFDALVSCLASRTGAPKDAWAIDHQAHMNALSVAKDAGIPQMVLLSAICVQKPVLEFQRAKLAFEEALIGSGLTYSIVRPTAFFKSLSGQIDRVRAGKPYLVFSDGRLTACKPISDRDLAAFIADCLEDREKQNRVLPIGGPGPAITPIEQGERLFALTGREARFRHVPVGFLSAVIAVLSTLGRIIPRLKDKAELARIARYYATESMLVLNEHTGQYDAPATPETGRDTLFDFYERVLSDGVSVDRGDHAVF